MARDRTKIEGLEHRVRNTARSSVVEYRNPCPICKKERWVRKSLVNSNCRACASTAISKERDSGKDYILVEHQAKGRKAQKVKKYKSSCASCGKDLGYRFKTKEVCNCNSCGIKNSYAHKDRKINPNHLNIRNYHKTPFQGTVCTRSSYESFYIEYLNNNKIDYFYEAKTFVFKDGSSYLPDLYLPETDTYIELKGFMDAVSEYKLNQMKEEYPQVNIKVLRLSDITKLGFNPNDLSKSFEVSINGDKWKVTILNKKAYKKFHGEDSEAITDVIRKEIYFDTDSCSNYETITHEISHAYFSYLCLDSTTRIKLLDFEEINCEFLAKNCGKILATSAFVYKKVLLVLEKRYKITITEGIFKEFEVEESDKVIKFFKALDRMVEYPENNRLVDLLIHVARNS